MKNKIKLIFSTFFITILLASCSYFGEKKLENGEETTESQPKKKRINPNVRQKVLGNEGGIIFSNKSKGPSFATSNPLWRASLDVLDFMPLDNASYSGGIIVTDWYGKSNKEQIKITVRFTSNEVTVGSFSVQSHKKICDENNNCTISKGKEDLENKLKDKIIERAREIKISSLKKTK
jgi:hypothetical protein